MFRLGLMIRWRAADATLARVIARQEIQRHRVRKLWRVTEPAFDWIKHSIELFERGIECLGADTAVGVRLSGLGFAQRFNYSFAGIFYLIAILFPGRRDSFKEFLESRMAIPILRRKISSADERP